MAADLLKQGAVVVFPTDTVYGIGCNPWDAAAIGRLYAAKRRTPEKGLPILISDRAAVGHLLAEPLPTIAERLIEQFWPGPLSIVVRRSAALPAEIAPGDTIALRLPDDEIARRLITLAGGALATSSANISGKAAATSAEMAHEMLGDDVAAIIDNGRLSSGTPSTIVDCSGDTPTILRAGVLDKHKIDEILAAGECS